MGQIDDEEARELGRMIAEKTLEKLRDMDATRPLVAAVVPVSANFARNLTPRDAASGPSTLAGQEAPMDAAIRLIEAARRSGVRSLRMTVDREVGARLVATFLGVSLNAGGAKHDKVELEFEFFPPEKQ